MTSHSEHGGVVPFPSEAMLDRFVDTAKTRDWLLNNLVHLYDESFQLRVAWNVTTSQDGERPRQYGGVKFVSQDPFPLTVRADGRPAPIVVRFSTKKDTDITGAGSTWGVSVHALDLPPPVVDPTNPSTASSDHNTDDSKEHGPLVLEMDPSDVAWSDLDSDISKGGALGRVEVVWAMVSLWVESDASLGQDATPPELRSLNVREYVGDE